MRRCSFLVRLAAYLWAAPNTSVGLFFWLLAVSLGGRVAVTHGVAEFRGGLLGRWAGRTAFGAITFGHVILAVDRHRLSAVRRHERIHVRQYEIWGPFFLPAYALSSAWQWLRGRDPYRDNGFEKEAYEAARAPE